MALKLLPFYIPSLVKDHERFWSLQCFSLLCHCSVLLLKAVSAMLWCTWFCLRVCDGICFRMCSPGCINCDKPLAPTRQKPSWPTKFSVPLAQSLSDTIFGTTKEMSTKYVKSECPVLPMKAFFTLFQWEKKILEFIKYQQLFPEEPKVLHHFPVYFIRICEDSCWQPPVTVFLFQVEHRYD